MNNVVLTNKSKNGYLSLFNQLQAVVIEEVEKIRKALNIQEDIYLDVVIDNHSSRWGAMARKCGNEKRYNKQGVSYKGTLYMSKISFLSDSQLQDTVMHELLHLVSTDGKSHTGMWKRFATIINIKYGYNISRCGSAEDFGIAKKDIYKYIIECPKCKHQWGYNRLVRAVKNPSIYTCGSCKKELVRVR